MVPLLSTPLRGQLLNVKILFTQISLDIICATHCKVCISDDKILSSDVLFLLVCMYAQLHFISPAGKSKYLKEEKREVYMFKIFIYNSRPILRGR